ncbi:MAG: UTP--glucose-1-phosphate uridylyltransferase GalU [Alphaproteobacteria bacterium]|nr:UTP--glucose-1-phosphate uridylyltransferase GalU [Alphaproteobacteria bacterium]
MHSSSPIKKAIFPVGGLGTRFLPATKSMPKEMLPVVDKPLIQYAVEEAAEAGVEEFIFVTGRGKSAIEDHFDHSMELEQTLESRSKTEALALVRDMMHQPGSVAYIRQQEPAGLGHAVWCARHIVADEPVAVLLADDLIKAAAGKKNCLGEMVDAWSAHGGNMVAAMEVPLNDTSSYGIITPGDSHGPLTEVNGLVEKPKPEDAPSRLAVVGRYIIEPGVFSELSRMERGAGGEIQLTDSLARRIGEVPFHGMTFSGTRFDCGSKLGFLQANVAFALDRDDLAADLSQWMKDQNL